MGDKDKVTGYITPVIDVKVGVSVDFDIENNEIYWVEVEKEGDTNGTLYKTSLGGGEKVDFFAGKNYIFFSSAFMKNKALSLCAQCNVFILKGFGSKLK